jgi:hypothetical protein
VEEGPSALLVLEGPSALLVLAQSRHDLTVTHGG